LAEVETSDQKAWGERISVLRVMHVNAHRTYNTQRIEMDGGVDSGQFGFFDKDFYRNDEAAKDLKKYDFGRDREGEGEEWYGACCNHTLSEESWGVLPQGAVSSSGFGDGSYPVFGEKDENGEWAMFEVIFISDEDFDDEDKYYEDEDEDEEN